MESRQASPIEWAPEELDCGASIRTALREEGGCFAADILIRPPRGARWRSADGMGLGEELWASRTFGSRAEAEAWLARVPCEEIDARAEDEALPWPRSAA